jgi:hypothetical protein
MVGWYPNSNFVGKSFQEQQDQQKHCCFCCENNHAFDTMPTPGVVVSYINVTTMQQATL